MIAEFIGGRAKCENFGMSTRVAVAYGSIVRRRNDLTTRHDNGTYRNFTLDRRDSCFGKRGTHVLDIAW